MGREAKKPSLADVSIAARTLRGRRRDMENFLSPLLEGLAIEAVQATQDSKSALVAARERLKDADATLSRIIDEISDRRLGAKILEATYGLAGASADAISRIERKRLPPILEKITKSQG